MIGTIRVWAIIWCRGTANRNINRRRINKNSIMSIIGKVMSKTVTYRAEYKLITDKAERTNHNIMHLYTKAEQTNTN